MLRQSQNLYSPEVDKCCYLYIHKQICSKVTVIRGLLRSIKVEMDRSNPLITVICLLQENTALPKSPEPSGTTEFFEPPKPPGLPDILNPKRPP